MLADVCLKRLEFIPIPGTGDTVARDPLRYGADNLLFHTMRASKMKQISIASRIRKLFWSREKFLSWFQFVWEEGEMLRQDLILLQLKSNILNQNFRLTMPTGITPLHILALATKTPWLFNIRTEGDVAPSPHHGNLG